MLRSLTRDFKLKTNGFAFKPAKFSSTSGDGSSSRKLEGKVALITGGASGIGKATAAEFIKQGAKVIIADIDDRRGPQTADELGSDARFIHCDVTVEAQVARAVETAMSHHQKLDIMFNNAGTGGAIFPPSIADLDMEGFDRVLRVNVRGTVLGIKHAARVMIPAGSGSILCTSSITGRMGGLGPHAYTISKFAIPGMVKTAASELCKHGIRINCISPTVVPTPLAISYFKEMFVGATDEQIVEIINGAGELKGAECEEIDVAKAAVYLASDDAKYVTGHDLIIDGGFTCFKTLNLPTL